jgi:phenylpropionate dioxygenase-like ring-hydroxylating dioxygenase large terminal subunit
MIFILILLLDVTNSLLFKNLFNNKLFKNRLSIPKDNNYDLINNNKLINNNLLEQQKYNLNWYVIGTPDTLSNQPNKITIWDKNYVVWKNNDKYNALDDVCSHKSASLSLGEIIDNNVMCPYHGYQFNNNGTLVKVPGINFTNSCIHNIQKYDIIEKNGWVYLNIYNNDKDFEENIFVEEEADNNTFSAVHLNMDYDCCSRILSENSLDIMHIAFVHTFGNKENPRPYYEDPPKIIDYENFHVKTSYLYKSGSKSVAKKIFQADDLTIENEFILPHTTIARVKFGNLVSTVITFALPISKNKTKLFVKTYRNFWNTNIITKYLGDKINYDMMYKTMMEDKAVVESIDSRFIDGKFNMKFDKLQNTYVTLYKKLIYNYTNSL